MPEKFQLSYLMTCLIFVLIGVFFSCMDICLFVFAIYSLVNGRIFSLLSKSTKSNTENKKNNANHYFPFQPNRKCEDCGVPCGLSQRGTESLFHC